MNWYAYVVSIKHVRYYNEKIFLNFKALKC